jgi:hypothetical protein
VFSGTVVPMCAGDPQASGGCSRRRLQTLSLDNACCRHHTQRRHVLRDNGARADDRAATDCHSRGDRGCGADPHIILDDGRRDLARQIINSYSDPGQVVLDFDADAHLCTTAAVAGRVYLSLPRIRILLDLSAAGVDLIVVRWPRPHRDARAVSPTPEHDLARSLRSLLGAYGHAVIAFDPPPPGVLHAAQAAPLIAAAAQVGLGHRQDVIHLDTGLRGDVLDTTGLPPAAQPRPAGWQHQVHRRLLVLSPRAGRHV